MINIEFPTHFNKKFVETVQNKSRKFNYKETKSALDKKTRDVLSELKERENKKK